MKVIPAWSDILHARKLKRRKITLKTASIAGVLLFVFLIYTAPLIAKEIQISQIELESDSFHINEEVAIDIGSFDASDVKIVLETRSGDETLEVADFDVTDKKITVNHSKKIPPGKNKIKLVEGNRTIFEEEFTWGVLALNFNKSVYSPNENALIHLGVLDEFGEMVCDAEVNLRITSPSNETTTISTKDAGIKVNPQCSLKTFSLTPDYETSYTFESVGDYKIELEAITQNGSNIIHDKISVQEDIPFDVERVTATRIYPPNIYPVILKIKANRDFTGDVVEVVPREFNVYYPDDGTSFELKYFESYKTLTWTVDIEKGEELNLSYNYLAPRISPDLHLLGKVKFVEEKQIVNAALDANTDLDANTPVDSGTSEPLETSYDSSQSSFFASVLKSINNLNPVRAADVAASEEAAESTVSAEIGNDVKGASEVSIDALTVELDGVVDASILDETLNTPPISSQYNNNVETVVETVFEEARQWQIAADAFGDYAVYRQNATGAQISTSTYDVPWDTTVVDTSSTFTLQANDSDIDLADDGHYLVLYNIFTEDFSGIERRDALTWLSIGGVDSPYGRAMSYIRDSGGTTEGYQSGAAIIEASAGEDLQLHIVREDTNVDGETNIRGGTNGISVIKLFDGWDYLRTYLATNTGDISSNTAFTALGFDTNDEIDTGSFEHSTSVNPEDITLKGPAGSHFLVTANIKVQQTANSGNRQNYEMMLSLDGSEIDDTRVSAYLRGNSNSDGTYNSVMSYSGIITKTSASDQVLNVEYRRESLVGATTVIVGDQTGINIVALPNSADYVRISNSTSTQQLDTARTAITFDQTDEEDTGAFDHDNTNTSRINIDLADDYLFFGTLYGAKNSTTDGTRETLRGDWRLNGSTLIPYGGFGAFIRGDQSTTDSYTGGASGGVLLNGLTTSDYVELTQINEAANGTATYQGARMGIQAVSMSSLFDNIPVTEQLHYRWRDDSASLNTASGWLDGEDVDIASDQNTTVRLRLEVANTGTGDEAASRTYELQFAAKGVQPTCSSVTGWAGVADSGSDAFDLYDTSNINDGGSLTPGLLANSESYSFVTGAGHDTTDTTASLGPLAEGEYTELEYSLRATTNSTKGETYCFRVYDTTASSPVDLYSVYPEFTVNNPDITQSHFRWRDDSTDLNTTGGWLAVEDSNVIGDISKSTIYRLRFEVSNEGTSPPATGKQYEIEFADKTGHASCAVADNWTGMSNSGSDGFDMVDTTNISPDGESVTSSLLANSEGYSFVNGEAKDVGDTTSTISPLDSAEYTELEYSFEATANATNGTTYCFRVKDNLSGNPLDTYDVYPEAIILAPPSVGGELAIYREATGNEDIGYTPFDMTWDTNVHQDSLYTKQGNNSDIDLGDGGHYLVMYNIFTDLGSDGGINRRQLQSWLSVGGVAVPYGYGAGYVRDSGGSIEGYNAASAIIEASAGDDLQAHIVRVDSNPTPQVGLRPATSGLMVLKLNDTWDYLRAYHSNRVETVNTYTSFTDVEFDTNDEVDTDSFEHSQTVNPDEITLKGSAGKHFLVTANVSLNQDASSGTRQNYEMRLALDGAEIDGTRVSGYIRGSDGTYDTTLNYAGIITKTSGSDEVLTVQLRRESSGGANTDIVNDTTAISIVALPDTADYIRLTNQTGSYDITTARYAFDWDNILEEDLSSFDLDGTTISRINIENTDDYMFFSSIYNAGTATSNREQPVIDIRVDGSTIQNYGGHGSYNRGDITSLTSGSSNGVILRSLADTSYVELTQANEAVNASSVYQADRIALQGVSLTSLFSASPNTNQLHYRWRDDTTDLNSSGGWLATEDNDSATALDFLTTYRLRIEIANTGDAAQLLSKKYQLQFADKTGHASCAVADNWTGVDDTPSDAFDMVGSTNIDPDGESTTSGLLANSETYSYVNGEGRDADDTSGNLGPLDVSEYTELEFAFQATINAIAENDYCLRVYDASLGSELDTYSVYPEFTTTVNPNSSPDAPTNLNQVKVTGSTSLATGDWTDETQIRFEADVSDADNPEQIQLCVEYRTLGNAFTDIEIQCGTAASYSGSAVTASVTVSSINDDTEYHWQVRAKDDDGAYSSWVAYGGNAESARDFGVDSTAPTGGAVYDGAVTSIDQDFSTAALDSLSANWGGFNANASGLDRYEYSIGTTQGATDIKGWTDNNTTTSVTTTGLTLQSSQIYYFNVRAIDIAGNVQSAVSSDGQMITPSLSFSITPSQLNFDVLNSANSYTDTKTATLTTSTNAYNGYLIRAYITDLLSSPDSATNIQNFTGGTYALPDAWLGTDRGFGYTSSDILIQGVNKFSPATCAGGGDPPCYAPFSQTAPGDIIADHESLISGTAIGGEEFTITYKVQVDPDQGATDYTTTVIYTVTAVY